MGLCRAVCFVANKSKFRVPCFAKASQGRSNFAFRVSASDGPIRDHSRPFAGKTSIRILQKETKVTKTHFQHTLRASFSWVPSVQISESEQQLVSEVIPSVSSVASCKIRCRFGCGSAGPDLNFIFNLNLNPASSAAGEKPPSRRTPSPRGGRGPAPRA